MNTLLSTLALKENALFFSTPLKWVVGVWWLWGVKHWQKIRLPFYQNGYGIGYLHIMCIIGLPYLAYLYKGC